MSSRGTASLAVLGLAVLAGCAPSSSPSTSAPADSPASVASDPFCDGFATWSQTLAARNATDDQGGTYWALYGFDPAPEDPAILLEIQAHGVLYAANVDANALALDNLAAQTDDADALAAIAELQAANTDFFAPVSAIMASVTSFADFHERAEPIMEDPQYRGGYDLGVQAARSLTNYAQERCSG